MKKRPTLGRRSLRLRAEDWRRAVRELDLSPQQARVVALLLEGRQDKQIAAAMKLRVSTLRTYFSRIFERTGTSDRVGLVLRVFQSVYDGRAAMRPALRPAMQPVINNDDSGNDGLLSR